MRAVLLADTPGANSRIGGQTVFDRLTEQLNSYGVTDITVIARPAYVPNRNVTVIESSSVLEDLEHLTEYATACTDTVLIATADLIAADTAMSQILSDPTRRSGALVTGDNESASLATQVRTDRGMVTSVSTHFHVATDAKDTAAGLIKISEPYLTDWRNSLRQLQNDDITSLAPTSDTWSLQLLALVRAGTKMTAYQVPGVPYGRVDSTERAEALLAKIDTCDEDAVRLKLCVKRDDDLFATYCISSYSRHIVLWCQRWKFTPVAITWVSILFAAVAAGMFAQGTKTLMIAGAVAMYISFVLDCVDGQLARYTHHFTAFGGWLDMIADRAKEYLIYGGLAFGAASAGLTWAWPLAITAITVQVVRHMTDTWYGTMQDAATLRQAERSLLAAGDSFSPAGNTGTTGSSAAVRIGQKLGKLSAQFTANRRSGSYWFKRTIVFPVGERWLIMGLGAAIFDGRVALALLLAWQCIAFAYTLLGRTLRSWAAKVPVLAREGDISTHRDDGIISRYLRAGAPPLLVTGLGLVLIIAATVVAFLVPDLAKPAVIMAGLLFLAITFTADNDHTGPLDWLVPAGLRAGEFGFIIICGITAGVPSLLIFTLLGVLSLYHYDLAARIDKAASPLDSRAFGLGWDGRVLLVMVSLIPGLGVWVYTVITTYIALVFLIGTLWGRRQLTRDKQAKAETLTANV